MKKKKVISFFLVLLLFAFALTFIEVLAYGKAVGFFGFQVGSASANNLDITNNKQDLFFFGLYVLLFILLSAFVFDYLVKYRNKTERENHTEVPFKKKVIKLDLTSPTEFEER